MDLNDYNSLIAQYENELKEIKAESSDLIDEFYALKDNINNHTLSNEQKTTAINLLINIIESKLTNHSKRIKLTENFVNENFLKAYSKQDDTEYRDSNNTNNSQDTDYIDTKALAKKLNKFLTDHNITQTLFNREVAGMIQLRFHLFLKNPLEWSQYQEKTRKRILKIHEFFNNHDKIEQFLSKFTNAVSTSDYIDTKLLAKRLNKFLIENNVTQAFFNREIANMNSICFHMFVKKPSEWSQYRDLTRKKLENIDQFLKDKERIAKFLEKFSKKAFKRGYKSDLIKQEKLNNNSSTSSSNFNEIQLNQLNGIFKTNQYPTVELVEFISNRLNLTVSSISNWFSMMRNMNGNNTGNNHQENDDDNNTSGNNGLDDDDLNSANYIPLEADQEIKIEFLNDKFDD